MIELDVELAFTLVGAVIFVGFIGSYIFQRFGIPEVLSLIFLGIIIGPVAGIVDPENFENISQIFASIALMIILFDGGLNLQLSKVLEEAARSTILALSCFALSAISVGIISSLLLFHNWLVGFMLGAVVGGTSGAIVVPVVLKMKDVKESTKIKMSIETTITDVLCVVTAIAIANYILPTGDAENNALKSIVTAFSSGIMIGLFSGIIWLKIMKITKPLQYSFMLTLAFVFVIFACTQAVGGSGPVAALIVGLVISNGEEIGRMFRYKQKSMVTKSMKDFHAEISFFVKSFFFVYTGLIITIQSFNVVIYGLILTAILFGVRHISIQLTMKHEDLKDRELMTLLIPRGLAAAVLATIPISYGFAEEGIITENQVNIFVGITFIIIISTVIVPTIGIPLGKRRWVDENMKKIIAKKEEKKKEKKLKKEKTKKKKIGMKFQKKKIDKEEEIEELIQKEPKKEGTKKEKKVEEDFWQKWENESDIFEEIEEFEETIKEFEEKLHIKKQKKENSKKIDKSRKKK